MKIDKEQIEIFHFAVRYLFDVKETMERVRVMIT